MPIPRIAPATAGRVPCRTCPDPMPLSYATWIIRNPAALIVGESMDPLGWRVADDGGGCVVSVPPFASPGTGYEVLHRAEEGHILRGPFEVATESGPARRQERHLPRR